MDTFNQKKTFDVNNYGTEDLLGILNLIGDAPINKEKIDEKVKELKYQLRSNKKKDKVYEFLDHASIKLKKQFDRFNKQTWVESYENDDSEASKVFSQQYQSNKNPKKNLILNEESNIIGRPLQSQQNRLALQGTVQGNKNPIERKTIKRIVNFIL